MDSAQDRTVDRKSAVGAVMLLLQRQFWVICLIVATGTLSSLAYSRMQSPNYEATAVVQVLSGVDTEYARAQLTSPRNLLAMVMRHGLTSTKAEASLGRAAVLLRQAIAVQDLTSEAGQTLGLDPQVAGVVVSVLLPDPELSARIANDLVQQLLDGGNAGQFGAHHEDLAFYRREEMRLWEESSALQAELAALSIVPNADDTGLLDQRRLNLMQDQYLEVRHRLASLEVEARMTASAQANQVSLLRRATSTEAVSVLRNGMLVGVAGSLLLAVTLAFVLDRRYPGLQRGLGIDLARWGRAVWRLVDDPARPILGVPRFLVISAGLVCGLIGLAALLR